MARSRWFALVVVVAIYGCKKDKTPRFDGPMPVTFGACVGPTVAWVSGPRPLPFTPAEAEGSGVAAAAPPSQADDQGGQGTRLALDEGRIAAGQRGRADPAAHPQFTRQEAIELTKPSILRPVPGERTGVFASLTTTANLAFGFDDASLYGSLLGNVVGEVTDGAAVDPAGSGGGGASSGTISSS